jgi:hypothetical protein
MDTSQDHIRLEVPTAGTSIVIVKDGVAVTVQQVSQDVQVEALGKLVAKALGSPATARNPRVMTYRVLIEAMTSRDAYYSGHAARRRAVRMHDTLCTMLEPWVKRYCAIDKVQPGECEHTGTEPGEWVFDLRDLSKLTPAILDQAGIVFPRRRTTENLIAFAKAWYIMPKYENSGRLRRVLPGIWAMDQSRRRSGEK